MIPRLLPVALLVGLTACQAEPVKVLAEDEIKTISVTGVGEIEVMPDRFVISGAVIKQSENLTDAMNELADVVNNAHQNLADIGLSDSGFNFASVQTTGVQDPECLLFNAEARRINVTKNEDDKGIKEKICEDVKKQAGLSFTYTGSPVDRAGHAISALTEAGAVRVSLNGFKVSNIETLELEAADKALENARNKAARLAETGGAKIKGVKNLSAYQPTYNYGGAQAPNLATYGAGETTRLLQDNAAGQTVAAMNLKPGPQVISASIALEFIYE